MLKPIKVVNEFFKFFQNSRAKLEFRADGYPTDGRVMTRVAI